MANERARALRKNQTEAERKLWHTIRLRQLNGYKFRRQYPLGRYIVDFVCLEKKLIVELDGGHHGEDGQMEHDLERDQWLRSQGFRVLRIWNARVFKEHRFVLDEIYYYLRNDEAPPHEGV